MSKRLDQERQKTLTPLRMEYAFNKLFCHGIKSMKVNDEFNCIEFYYKDEKVKFFPFTGWATGKSIKDGRGIENLLKQLV